jgi:transcriptional regulator
MYTPKHFQPNSITEIQDFIRQNSFGILISQLQGNLLATHIPLEFSDDCRKLIGHISRSNPQWKQFSKDEEVLTIFNGPHTYISSSWYNHENVPTWNYIAAHVYGKIQIIEGDQLRLSLKHLIDKYEKDSANPASIEKLSPEYITRAMSSIVGFEIIITKIEASYKLSQNRDEVNYNNIISELEKRTDENSLVIADVMKKNRCPV